MLLFHTTQLRHVRFNRKTQYFFGNNSYKNKSGANLRTKPGWIFNVPLAD